MKLKSYKSNPSGNCVVIEFDAEHDQVIVTDDKLEGQPILCYPMSAWRGGRAVRFIAIYKGAVPQQIRDIRPESEIWFRVTRNDVTLYFDMAERDAFIAAIDEQKWVPALADA